MRFFILFSRFLLSTLSFNKIHVSFDVAPVSRAQLLSVRNFAKGITKSNCSLDCCGTFIITSVTLKASCLLPSLRIRVLPRQSVLSKNLIAIRSEITIELRSVSTFRFVPCISGKVKTSKKLLSAYKPFSVNVFSPLTKV